MIKLEMAKLLDRHLHDTRHALVCDGLAIDRGHSLSASALRGHLAELASSPLNRSATSTNPVERATGVGALAASGLSATDPHSFKIRPRFAAWLSVTPKQNSIAGKVAIQLGVAGRCVSRPHRIVPRRPSAIDRRI